MPEISFGKVPIVYGVWPGKTLAVLTVAKYVRGTVQHETFYGIYGGAESVPVAVTADEMYIPDYHYDQVVGGKDIEKAALFVPDSSPDIVGHGVVAERKNGYVKLLVMWTLTQEAQAREEQQRQIKRDKELKNAKERTKDIAPRSLKWVLRSYFYDERDGDTWSVGECPLCHNQNGIYLDWCNVGDGILRSCAACGKSVWLEREMYREEPESDE